MFNLLNLFGEVTQNFLGNLIKSRLIMPKELDITTNSKYNRKSENSEIYNYFTILLNKQN